MFPQHPVSTYHPGPLVSHIFFNAIVLSVSLLDLIEWAFRLTLLVLSIYLTLRHIRACRIPPRLPAPPRRAPRRFHPPLPLVTAFLCLLAVFLLLPACSTTPPALASEQAWHDRVEAGIKRAQELAAPFIPPPYNAATSSLVALLLGGTGLWGVSIHRRVSKIAEHPALTPAPKL